jgi:hypothetical protein
MRFLAFILCPIIVVLAIFVGCRDTPSSPQVEIVYEECPYLLRVGSKYYSLDNIVMINIQEDGGQAILTKNTSGYFKSGSGKDGAETIKQWCDLLRNQRHDNNTSP